jgi:nucleotide-binding universal stress UspA family protein
MKFTTVSQGGEKEIVFQANQSAKRTLLFPIDTSPHSISTIEWAKKALILDGDLIIFITVQTQTSHHDCSKSDAQDLLHQFASKVDNPSTGIILQGDPKIELCKEIDLLKPTIVVIGTKGLGVLDSSLGSTAQYVSTHSKYPVLIAHPTPHLPSLSE